MRVLGCLLWPLAASGNPLIRAHFLVMTQLFLSDRPSPRRAGVVCVIVLTSSCWRITYPNEPLTVSPAAQRPLFLTGIPVQLGDDVCPGWILTFGSSMLWGRALGPWVKLIQFWQLWFYSDWVYQEELCTYLLTDTQGMPTAWLSWCVFSSMYTADAPPMTGQLFTLTDTLTACSWEMRLWVKFYYGNEEF